MVNYHIYECIFKKKKINSDQNYPVFVNSSVSYPVTSQASHYCAVGNPDEHLCCTCDNFAKTRFLHSPPPPHDISERTFGCMCACVFVRTGIIYRRPVQSATAFEIGSC